MSEPTKVKESAHTPGKWHTNHSGSYIEADSGYAIANIIDTNHYEQNKANARRIVACVNACEGIDNEWLEANSGMLQGHDHALERERDHLRERVAELERALRDLVNAVNDPDADSLYELAIANALLAKERP